MAQSERPKAKMSTMAKLCEEFAKNGKYADAFPACSDAARTGDAGGQRELGDMYAKGLGVVKDYEVAAKWYLMAAEQGDGNAQVSLGDMYWHGRGVKQDDNRAVMWFRRSAERGNPGGQLSLAGAYYVGAGELKKNEALSLALTRKAAVQGYGPALKAIASDYLHGYNFPVNYVYAYAWASVCVVGCDESQEILDMLRESSLSKMTAAELKEAQRLVREWRVGQDIGRIRLQ